MTSTELGRDTALLQRLHVVDCSRRPHRPSTQYNSPPANRTVALTSAWYESIVRRRHCAERRTLCQTRSVYGRLLPLIASSSTARRRHPAATLSTTCRITAVVISAYVSGAALVSDGIKSSSISLFPCLALAPLACARCNSHAHKRCF